MADRFQAECYENVLREKATQKFMTEKKALKEIIDEAQKKNPNPVADIVISLFVLNFNITMILIQI